jgi:hypothetical protein
MNNSRGTSPGDAADRRRHYFYSEFLAHLRQYAHASASRKEGIVYWLIARLDYLIPLVGLDSMPRHQQLGESLMLQCRSGKKHYSYMKS